MSKGLRRITPAIERFWQKVSVDKNGCWLWTGYVLPDGYRRFRRGRAVDGVVSAHKWSYEHFVGPVPEGLELDHLCRVRRCCNPDHLEAVTRAENVRRGDLAKPRTHCPKGHPYSEENTVRDSRGAALCRICKREWEIRAYEKRKQRKAVVA